MGLLRTIFSEPLSGTIGRGAFFLLFGLVFVTFAALVVGLGLSGGIVNHLFVFSPLACVLGYSMLNLSAKRCRDIGFRGWGAVAVTLLFLYGVSVTIHLSYGFLIAILAYAALLILPRGMLGSAGA